MATKHQARVRVPYASTQTNKTLAGTAIGLPGQGQGRGWGNIPAMPSRRSQQRQRPRKAKGHAPGKKGRKAASSSRGAARTAKLKRLDLIGKRHLISDEQLAKMEG